MDAISTQLAAYMYLETIERSRGNVYVHDVYPRKSFELGDRAVNIDQLRSSRMVKGRAAGSLHISGLLGVERAKRPIYSYVYRTLDT